MRNLRKLAEDFIADILILAAIILIIAQNIHCKKNPPIPTKPVASMSCSVDPSGYYYKAQGTYKFADNTSQTIVLGMSDDKDKALKFCFDWFKAYNKEADKNAKKKRDK